MPKMTLIARSLDHLTSFSLFLLIWAVIHVNSSCTGVFRNQELVKVGDGTAFYLHYFSVVGNTVEEAVFVHRGEVERPYTRCSEI